MMHGPINIKVDVTANEHKYWYWRSFAQSVVDFRVVLAVVIAILLFQTAEVMS